MQKKLTCTFILFVCSLIAHPSLAQECTTKADYPVAASEQLFEKACNAIYDKDSAALQQLLDTGLVVLSRDGVQVFTVDRGLSYATIRLKGDNHTLWTLPEALNCK